MSRALFMAETGFKVFRRGVPKESSTIGPLKHLDPAYSKTKILGLIFLLLHFLKPPNFASLWYGRFPSKNGSRSVPTSSGFQVGQMSNCA